MTPLTEGGALERCDECGYPIEYDGDFGRWLHSDYGPDGQSFRHDAVHHPTEVKP